MDKAVEAVSAQMEEIGVLAYLRPEFRKASEGCVDDFVLSAVRGRVLREPPMPIVVCDF